jgi:outer membrane protein TolC
MINLEVQQVKIQLEEAYESIEIAKKNIKEAEESLEETKASFEVGLNTTTDLLNAQAQWQAANSRLIEALAQFEILQTSWQKVTGNLKPIQ